MAGPEEEDEEAKDKTEALREKQLGSDAYKKRDFENAEKHFATAWDKWPKDITFLTNLAGECFRLCRTRSLLSQALLVHSGTL